MGNIEGARELKLRIARAQLGTALALYIRDYDPLSVHALVCGGRECISGVADTGNFVTNTSAYIAQYPEKNLGAVIRDHNRYWTAIKHFYSNPKVGSVRDDIETMSSFSDEVNDHYLWDGWLTYQGLTHRLPPEAQVFQVWWLALYPDIFAKLTPTAASFFPNIQLDSRPEQKRRLKRATERTRKAPEILSDKRTELTQLMLKWP